jgi:hypothetical protein
MAGVNVKAAQNKAFKLSMLEVLQAHGYLHGFPLTHSQLETQLLEKVDAAFTQRTALTEKARDFETFQQEVEREQRELRAEVHWWVQEQKTDLLGAVQAMKKRIISLQSRNKALDVYLKSHEKFRADLMGALGTTDTTHEGILAAVREHVRKSRGLVTAVTKEEFKFIEALRRLHKEFAFTSTQLVGKLFSRLAREQEDAARPQDVQTRAESVWELLKNHPLAGSMMFEVHQATSDSEKPTNGKPADEPAA